MFSLTFPDPPITSVSISLTLHTMQRQGWNSMASTGDRSWDREPGTSRSAAPAPGHPSPGAAIRCGATAAPWAGNLHLGKPETAKGDGNSQASHQEYKRNNRKKRLKKLMDSWSTSQWSGCFWLRNSPSSHYKACRNRAKETGNHLQQWGEYRAALPWCTLPQQRFMDFLSPWLHPFPISIMLICPFINKNKTVGKLCANGSFSAKQTVSSLFPFYLTQEWVQFDDAEGCRGTKVCVLSFTILDPPLVWNFVAEILCSVICRESEFHNRLSGKQGK